MHIQSLRCLKTLFIAVLVVLSSLSTSAQSEKVIYSFTGQNGGAVPEGGLISDSKGNLYGTAESGGTYGGGAVYELSPSSSGMWTEQLLHSFSFSTTDGAEPGGGSGF